MKKILVLVFFVASFMGSLTAQDLKLNESPTKETIKSESAENGQKGLLWKITGKDLDNPSFLFGTIHMIGKDDFFWPEGTKEAFSTCDRATFEINMDVMNDFSTQFSLLFGMVMDNGTTLKDLLSAEDYSLVKKKFDEMGMGGMFFSMFERVKPMILATFASGDIDPTAFSTGDLMSYEMEFMKMAKAQEKEMGGLETVEFQLSMFDSIPYDAQAQMLVDALKGSDTGADQFQDMVDIYTKQDLDGLQKMIQGDEQGIAEYEDVLLNGRNKNWIPIMGEMMAEKPTFFAVGAGHLPGKSGVINLLKEAGYNLEPVLSK